MLAKDLIVDVISLSPENSAEDALLMMHEYNLNYIPVVEQQYLIGIVSMDQILGLNAFTKPLSECTPFPVPISVKADSHFLDVCSVAAQSNTSIIAVVNEEGKYAGIITAETLMKNFKQFNSLKEEGGIVELEIDEPHFSLAEIARIVESNNAKILICITNIDKQVGTVSVLLKINTTDLASIVSTFERYEYQIRGVFHEVEYTENMKDRYDSFMKYLNV